MPSLAQIAAMAEDLYKKDYAKSDDFFDAEHFKFMACSVYSNILLQEYKESKLFNKQLEGFSVVDLSQDVLQVKEYTVEKEGDRLVAKIPERIITFPNDPLFSGIQRVKVIGDSCGELRKISPDDTHLVCLLPATNNIFYYIENSKVYFVNTGDCKLEKAKVEVHYVAEPDHENDDLLIPQTRSAEVITTTLQIIFGAAQGTLTDTTNDQNPNTSEQTEFNLNDA